MDKSTGPFITEVTTSDGIVMVPYGTVQRVQRVKRRMSWVKRILLIAAKTTLAGIVAVSFGFTGALLVSLTPWHTEQDESLAFVIAFVIVFVNLRLNQP